MPLTTRWSMVLAAGTPESPLGQEALAELCGTYWYPLYAYLRRSGTSGHDASELTQAFFAELLEKNLIGKADPERGRFRSFLLASFKNFVSNQRRADQAAKRGGKATIFSIDAGDAERRYLKEPVDDRPPDRIFERRWALTVIERALTELRGEYGNKGKGELFERLQPCLVGGPTQRYAEVASDLGLTESNVKISVYRLRQRFRDRLRTAVADTVGEPDEVPDELRHLVATVNDLA